MADGTTTVFECAESWYLQFKAQFTADAEPSDEGIQGAQFKDDHTVTADGQYRLHPLLRMTRAKL